ncbi:MAG: ferrochelatase, partial [Acidobacteria bacterium]|nr:ferrochelatase [Acidobacteriota bacterium]
LAGHFGLVVNGWLNHTRGGRWTEPPIDRALAHVTDAGFSRVVYFPYGFLGDNAESQLEGRVALEGAPSLEARHLPCLNESPRLLAVLAQQALEWTGREHPAGIRVAPGATRRPDVPASNPPACIPSGGSICAGSSEVCSSRPV